MLGKNANKKCKWTEIPCRVPIIALHISFKGCLSHARKIILCSLVGLGTRIFRVDGAVMHFDKICTKPRSLLVYCSICLGWLLIQRFSVSGSVLIHFARAMSNSPAPRPIDSAKNHNDMPRQQPPSLSNNPYFNCIMINPSHEIPDIPDLTSLSLRSALGPSNSIPVSNHLPFIPVDEWLNETTIAAAYQRMSPFRAS